MMVKTFLIQLLNFTRVYMICFIFPSASQLALIGLLHARAKLIAFKYKNKENRESDNHTTRLNWSPYSTWGGGDSAQQSFRTS